MHATNRCNLPNPHNMIINPNLIYNYKSFQLTLSNYQVDQTQSYLLYFYEYRPNTCAVAMKCLAWN